MRAGFGLRMAKLPCSPIRRQDGEMERQSPHRLTQTFIQSQGSEKQFLMKGT